MLVPQRNMSTRFSNEKNWQKLALIRPNARTAKENSKLSDSREKQTTTKQKAKGKRNPVSPWKREKILYISGKMYLSAQSNVMKIRRRWNGRNSATEMRSESGDSTIKKTLPDPVQAKFCIPESRRRERERESVEKFYWRDTFTWDKESVLIVRFAFAYAAPSLGVPFRSPSSTDVDDVVDVDRPFRSLLLSRRPFIAVLVLRSSFFVLHLL